MRVRTVDLQGCKYYGEVWQRIEDGMGWPEWFGKNLDALWDLLRDPNYTPEGTIVFKGVESLAGDAAKGFAQIRLKVLADLAAERPEVVVRFEG